MKKTLHEIPQVCCPRCAGGGKVRLSDELLAVLNLATLTKGITAVSVQNRIDRSGLFNTTAFNNRLNDLLELGLLRRERQGKTWFYFAVPKN